MEVQNLNACLRNNKFDVWFVKNAGELLPIDPSEVSVMEKLMSNGEIIETSEVAKVGDSVYIVRGPLVGLEGIVYKYCKRNRRVTISVTIAGMEKRVELEGTAVI